MTRREPDPYRLGPWKQCAACRRRYRPASADRKCYDCTPVKPTTPNGDR